MSLDSGFSVSGMPQMTFKTGNNCALPGPRKIGLIYHCIIYEKKVPIYFIELPSLRKQFPLSFLPVSSLDTAILKHSLVALAVFRIYLGGDYPGVSTYVSGASMMQKSALDRV